VLGSPGAVARPGLPQIRTCPIKAFGSSSHQFAAHRNCQVAQTGSSALLVNKEFAISQGHDGIYFPHGRETMLQWHLLLPDDSLLL
jgi:hypothetical protein